MDDLTMFFFGFMFVVIVLGSRLVWPTFEGHPFRKLIWLSVCTVVLILILVFNKIL